MKFLLKNVILGVALIIGVSGCVTKTEQIASSKIQNSNTCCNQCVANSQPVVVAGARNYPTPIVAVPHVRVSPYLYEDDISSLFWGRAYPYSNINYLYVPYYSY